MRYGTSVLLLAACVTPSFYAGPYVAVYVHPQAKVWPDFARVVQAASRCVEGSGEDARSVMRMGVQIYPEGWSLPGKHAPLHFNEFGGFLEGDKMLLSRVGESALDGAFVHELAHRTSGVQDHGPKFILAESELRRCVEDAL